MAPFHDGEMSERLKEPVLKTGEAQASVGSNPTLSATLLSGISYLQKYPRGRRGSPAKGVGCLKNAARVQIPPSAPKEEAKKDIGQKSPVFSRLPRPVDQRIYGPHFFDISILDLRSGGTQTRILNEESATCFWPGSWMQDPGFSIL